jgi:hemerythrin
MPLRRWTADLSVNHHLMDEQHKKLFALAEILWLSSERGEEHIDSVVQDLVDYTYTHFAEEEALLVKIGYGNFKQHKKRHGEIFTAVDTMVEKYSAVDRRLFVAELSEFVSEWLVQHIVSEDFGYSRFIAERRMRRIGDIPIEIQLSQVGSSSGADPLERLRKLKIAFDENLISKDEFDERKASIMGEF